MRIRKAQAPWPAAYGLLEKAIAFPSCDANAVEAFLVELDNSQSRKFMLSYPINENSPTGASLWTIHEAQLEFMQQKKSP
ncbi:hypothetical protein RCG24_05825 [Neobacillus sp. OS1-32]|uniref:hypothetical protein n=1 Tax=Neobacillus sp. OS1-32 TaxID=3070682 RepID=UPI0027DEAE43|nr:hypothetical protein [Neobacillus sp. OS1-32]WML31388.1 hypothetical protein RCG24_05825 [Neobacillus sp. OS1-32]